MKLEIFSLCRALAITNFQNKDNNGQEMKWSEENEQKSKLTPHKQPDLELFWLKTKEWSTKIAGNSMYSMRSNTKHKIRIVCLKFSKKY